VTPGDPARGDQSSACVQVKNCRLQKNSRFCELIVDANSQEEGFILSTCLDEGREFFKGCVLAFCVFFLDDMPTLFADQLMHIVQTNSKRWLKNAVVFGLADCFVCVCVCVCVCEIYHKYVHPT